MNKSLEASYLAIDQIYILLIKHAKENIINHICIYQMLADLCTLGSNIVKWYNLMLVSYVQLILDSFNIFLMRFNST